MTERKPRFDYNITGMPMEGHLTDRTREVMHRALDEGKDGYETYELMKDEHIRELRDDPDYRDELREIYQSAGYNFVSPTVRYHNLGRWRARESLLDWMHIVTSPSEAREVIDDGDVAVAMNTQRLGEVIGRDIDEIERLYNHGVQFGQLTHNQRNSLGDGCTARGDGGLSWRGVDAVERMNELGMVVDLAHCAKQTTMDAIEASDRPVAFSHTGSEAISPHPRMKSDEELEALADNDGWLGLLMIPSFVANGREDEVIDVYFEQLEYVREILGIERIGLASDWLTMPVGSVPERLEEVLPETYLEGYTWKERHDPKAAQGVGPVERYSEFWKLREEFEERGYSQEEIDLVYGESFLRFWERATG